MTKEAEELKREVRQFWNRQSCNAEAAEAVKFSREYFEQIEEFRYWDQPFIHSFAQFSRYHGKRVLEVGIGAATDFVQWLRAGVMATGIDLTEEAVEHARRRISVYGLPEPEGLFVADAENLPFESSTFDLGYSFGVLHHTPDTERAMAELVRVVKPGGEIRIMLYNRHSIYVINRWVKYALLRGRPWRSLRWILWHTQESVGTKGYTRNELRRMLLSLPLEQIEVRTEVTAADVLSASAFPPLNLFYRVCLAMAGWRYGWDPDRYACRPDAPEGDRRSNKDAGVCGSPARAKVRFTGNPLGFFHLIAARKISEHGGAADFATGGGTAKR